MKADGKDFWVYENEEYCSFNGIRLLAKEMNGGILPARSTVHRWLRGGLEYTRHIGRYIFKVSTVKHFLAEKDKNVPQWGYKKEV